MKTYLSFSDACHSPLPNSLEDATKEIMRLRRQLKDTNAKWANAIERRELDTRSLKGNLRAVQKELKEEHEKYLRLVALCREVPPTVLEGARRAMAAASDQKAKGSLSTKAPTKETKP